MTNPTETPKQTGVEETLMARARALARPEASADEVRPSVAVVEFRLGPDRYAVGLEHLRGVFIAETLAPLPGVPCFVHGITLFRGNVLSVLDVPCILGLEPGDHPSMQQGPAVVVLGNSSMTFGLLAEEVLGMRTVPEDEIQPQALRLEGERAARVLGVTGDGMVVLNGAALLEDPALVVRVRY